MAAFVAPKKLAGLDGEAERSLLAVLQQAQAAFEELSKRPVVTPLQRGQYVARVGELVRCAGASVLLPAATTDNASGRISLLIETPSPVRVAAVSGTVNGVDAVLFSAVGLVELVSNGAGGWVSEHSVGSGPSASAPVGAEYIVAAPHDTLTAERVAGATSFITPDFSIPGRAAWEWAGVRVQDTEATVATRPILDFTTGGFANSLVPVVLDDAGNDRVLVVHFLPTRDWGDISSTTSTLTIDNNVVTDAKLRDSAGLSVIGRAANSSGDPADIVASTANHVLKVNAAGTALVFEALALDAVPGIGFYDDTAFLAIRRNIDLLSTTGIVVTGTDVPASDEVTYSWRLADRNWGDWTTSSSGLTATINNDAVTYAKMQNISAAGRVLGLQVGASAPADPVELTGAEVTELLRYNTVATASISGTTNNLSPTGWSDATTTLELTLTADATLTGLDISGLTVSAGKEVWVWFRTGSFTLTISHDSGSSTAGNRFSNPRYTTRTYSVGERFLLRRDSTGHWAIVADGKGAFSSTAQGLVPASGGGTTNFLRADGSFATPLTNDSVTNAILANMAESRIKGRAESSGTGDPVDLTPSEVAAIIDAESITWTALQAFAQRFAWNGIISPTTLSANQNNYNPSGWAASNVVRLITNNTTTRNITGFAAPTPALSGAMKLIINVGLAGGVNGAINLVADSTDSSAGNRIAVPGSSGVSAATNLVIIPGAACLIWYDSTSSLWRALWESA